LNKEEGIIDYIDNSIDCLEKLKKKTGQINKVIDILQNAKENKNKVFLFGNGGSAATASHLICDLSKMKKMKAFALTDSIPLITAWSNDDDYSVIFKEQLKALAEKNDVVIGISGSGNSKNVIDAIKFANDLGCITIGLAGYNGGKLKDVANECIIVEINNMQISEDMHLILGHMIAVLID
jgi:D-sedoheptulose 7-phosphate isomerase